jgi:hypothetical protein
MYPFLDTSNIQSVGKHEFSLQSYLDLNLSKFIVKNLTKLSISALTDNGQKYSLFPANPDLNTAFKDFLYISSFPCLKIPLDVNFILKYL